MNMAVIVLFSSDTTHDYSTIPFHIVMFSAVLAELAKSIPIHPLKLSSNI